MKRVQKLIAFMLVVVLTASLAVVVTAEEEKEQEVTFTEVDEIIFTVASVNVRKGPGLDYEVITLLEFGHALRRIGVGDNGWSKVIYQNQTAYMYTPLISVNPPYGMSEAFDDAELKRQIALANGLNQPDYTKESWEALILALDFANLALGSQSQEMADESVQALKDAVAALKKVDYTALEQILLETDSFLREDPFNEQEKAFMDAVNNGKALLTSGDQAAVDAAAQQIGELLEKVKQSVADLKTPEVVIQEVPVEVPPTDDYCNIPVHHTWPVLFFVSLGINLVLGALIGVYVHKKKKTRNDDTPLVDYDIVDDTF